MINKYPTGPAATLNNCARHSVVRTVSPWVNAGPYNPRNQRPKMINPSATGTDRANVIRALVVIRRCNLPTSLPACKLAIVGPSAGNKANRKNKTISAPRLAIEYTPTAAGPLIAPNTSVVTCAFTIWIAPNSTRGGTP